MPEVPMTEVTCTSGRDGMLINSTGVCRSEDKLQLVHAMALSDVEYKSHK